MATKRTLIGRRTKPRITDEMVDLFIRCEELAPIYLAHMRADNCPNSDDGTHCLECREYLSLHCPAAPHNLIAYPDDRDELLRIELLAEVAKREAP